MLNIIADDYDRSINEAIKITKYVPVPFLSIISGVGFLLHCYLVSIIYYCLLHSVCLGNTISVKNIHHQNLLSTEENLLDWMLL